MLAKRNLIFTIKNIDIWLKLRAKCHADIDQISLPELRFLTQASVVILQRILMKFYLRQGNLSVHDLFATRCAFVVLK